MTSPTRSERSLFGRCTVFREALVNWTFCPVPSTISSVLEVSTLKRCSFPT